MGLPNSSFIPCTNSKNPADPSPHITLSLDLENPLSSPAPFSWDPWQTPHPTEPHPGTLPNTLPSHTPSSWDPWQPLYPAPWILTTPHHSCCLATAEPQRGPGTCRQQRPAGRTQHPCSGWTHSNDHLYVLLPGVPLELSRALGYSWYGRRAPGSAPERALAVRARWLRLTPDCLVVPTSFRKAEAVLGGRRTHAELCGNLPPRGQESPNPRLF